MKAYTKDVIKTILKGMKRFLALALISALGVCMMSGLTASCDDLRFTADTFLMSRICSISWLFPLWG